MSVESAEILVDDLEEIRQVLVACLTYFTAKDVAAAQMGFSILRKSPLTLELEAVKERLDGVFGDFLLARYEDEKDEASDESESEADEEGRAELSESGNPDDEEPYRGFPLGEPQIRTRSSRRIEPASE